MRIRIRKADHEPEDFESQWGSLLEEFRDQNDGGKIKHVYACAGLALYHAQCLETSLTTTLLIATKTAGELRTTEDFDQLDQELARLTLGGLLRRAEKLVDFDQEVQEILGTALKYRNYLAHHFFYEKAGDFHLEAGRYKMAEELLEYCHFFVAAGEYLDKANLQILKKYGLTEAMLKGERERLIASAAKAYERGDARTPSPE